MISNNTKHSNYCNGKLFYEPIGTAVMTDSITISPDEVWGGWGGLVGRGNVFISGTSETKEKHKVFHKNKCPCCGAPISKNDDECPYCNTVYAEDVFSWIEI